MASTLYLVLFVGLPLLMTVMQIVNTRAGGVADPTEEPLPRCSMRDFKRRDD